MSNKFRLTWGIHRGTMMSRVVGDEYKFDTEKECRDKFSELREWFTGPEMNCKIWFASIITPSKKHIKLCDGAPYS